MTRKSWKDLAESIEALRAVAATLIALVPAGLSAVAVDLVPPWPRGAVLWTATLCAMAGVGAYVLAGDSNARRLLLVARLLCAVGLLSLGGLFWSNSRYVVNPTPAGDGGERGVRSVRGFEFLPGIREDFSRIGIDAERADAETLLANMQWRSDMIWSDIHACRLLSFGLFALPFVLISSSFLLGAIAAGHSRQAARETRRTADGRGR